MSDLVERVGGWIEGDPDPDDRAELAALLARSVAGADAATAELADRFAGPLSFGTAGLRAAMAAGPNRMNRAVVMRASAGLAAWLTQRHEAPAVVLGHDARHCSARFAADTADVLAGAGVRVLRLPPELPTPVLAFAVRLAGLQTDAGVMVTASHNPATDNGWKVFLADGAQLAAPHDAEIAAYIAAAPPAAAIDRVERAEPAGPAVLAGYLGRAAALLTPGGPRTLRVVYTPLHGVAGTVFRAAWREAGFDDLVEVPEQAAPDPDFPTVAFPNPEEPGTLDLARDLALKVGADLVLAHDPDGDRCAVMVPVLGRPGEVGDYRRLSGDEVGVLLAEHLLAHGRIAPDAALATTVVSSAQLADLAAAHGHPFVRTLTGFKWLARVPNLGYAYEEALGYCVDPRHVADKDGITAALLIAEMAALSRELGMRLTDRLDAIHRRYGLHVSAARSVPLDGPPEPLLAALRAHPPRTLGGHPVRVDDLCAEGAPPTPGVVLTTDQLTAIVRPSGTEPKLKLYLHASVAPPLADLAATRAALERRLADAAEELVDHLTKGAP